MKKLYIITLAAAALLGMSACNKTQLDPLTGVFPAPSTAKVAADAGSCTAYKADGKRCFDLHLAGTYPLKATLVGNSYFLTANTYSEADESQAKNGNYILGKTTIDGKNVKSGNITVGQEGESHYTVVAVLFAADGSAYKLEWEGDLTFAPDPEPVALTQVFTAQSNLPNGVSSVTLSLGSAEISSSFDMATYQTTWSGTGNYLAIDLYSADGYLHEGTYTASAVGGDIHEGEFGIGYDTEFWGMTMYNWGTCWWTVTDGVTSAEKITSGTITVEKKGTKFVITWGEESTYPKWAVFEGAIDALLPPDVPTPDYTLADVVGAVTGADWQPVPGVESHTLTLTDKSGNAAAQFVLILSEGSAEIAGTYTCQEYASEPYLMGNGYDLSAWGMGIGGSYYYRGADVVLINAGETLEVTKYADGLYGFSGSTGYNFIASMEGFTPGGGGEDNFDGVVLTQFCGSSDYTGYGINLAGVELATEGVTVTPGAWGNTYGGDGNYIKLEFYSTDGKLAPGTYAPCAEGGNVGEGEFGIGYDGAWGASGTTWYTLVGGESSYVYVTDGTLEVSLDGDEYTIVLKSSAVNAKYVGKLSAE